MSVSIHVTCRGHEEKPVIVLNARGKTEQEIKSITNAIKERLWRNG